MLNNRSLIYHTVEVHFCDCAQQAKLIPVEKHSSSFLLKVGWGWGLSEKQHEETFWSGKNILYLNKGLDYTGVYIYQNSWNGTLKICVIINMQSLP